MMMMMIHSASEVHAHIHNTHRVHSFVLANNKPSVQAFIALHVCVYFIGAASISHTPPLAALGIIDHCQSSACCRFKLSNSVVCSSKPVWRFCSSSSSAMLRCTLLTPARSLYFFDAS